MPPWFKVSHGPKILQLMCDQRCLPSSKMPSRFYNVPNNLNTGKLMCGQRCLRGPCGSSVPKDCAHNRCRRPFRATIPLEADQNYGWFLCLWGPKPNLSDANQPCNPLVFSTPRFGTPTCLKRTNLTAHWCFQPRGSGHQPA